MCPLGPVTATSSEFHEVRRLYEAIKAKIIAAGSEKPELDSEFAQLRQVTGGYTVPATCAKATKLSTTCWQLDEAYQS